MNVSGVAFNGSPTESNYQLSNGSVSGFGTRVFRSGNTTQFDEATEGLVVTQGASTLGFGTAVGTAGSNLIMNNNFGSSMTETPSSIFARQTGPYTLAMTVGLALLGVGGLLAASRRRRRD